MELPHPRVSELCSAVDDAWNSATLSRVFSFGVAIGQAWMVRPELGKKFADDALEELRRASPGLAQKIERVLTETVEP